MQKMSGADLHFAVSDLKKLEGKRIAKIRKTASGIYLFKIGSEELLFQPGVRFHLTRQAHQAADSPDGFISYLRKNFEGKTAARISQYGTDRIVEIEARSKEKLLFELFRKGNLIVVGEDGIVSSCLNREDMGGRKIAKGERYAYPKATPFELKLPPSPSFCVKVNEKGEPVSYSLGAAGGERAFPSFSEAADFYYANQNEESGAERAAGEKMKKLLERLSSQEKALVKIISEKEDAKKAGDAVYTDFENVEKLLSVVRQMKKEGKDEGEIGAYLSARRAKIMGAELEIEL